MTQSPEQKIIEALERIDQKNYITGGRYYDQEVRLLCIEAIPIAKALFEEVKGLREKAEAMPIIEKILSRATRGKLGSGKPAKWYGLSATHEEIEQLRKMIAQKEQP